MRKILMAAMVFAGVQGAQAADMPDYALRGGNYETVGGRPNWEGFYIGGQGGYGVSNMDFKNATHDQIARMLVNTTIENEMRISSWPLLGKTMSHSSGFGGFIGYNSQWEDVVVGVDFSYMHGKFNGSSTGRMGRSYVTSDGYLNSVDATSTAGLSISDFWSARLRGGYMMGNFLPYAFVGGAFGIGDLSRTATVAASGVYVGTGTTLPPYASTTSATSGQPNHLLYGYSAGVGVDVMLVGGLFLRAEYEYLRFTSKVDTDINTVRVGLGYKF